MRQLIQKKIWCSKITCSSCGNKVQFTHGSMNKKNAILDLPSNSWNGWFVAIKNKELCPLCWVNSDVPKPKLIPKIPYV